MNLEHETQEVHRSRARCVKPCRGDFEHDLGGDKARRARDRARRREQRAAGFSEVLESLAAGRRAHVLREAKVDEHDIELVGCGAAAAAIAAVGAAIAAERLDAHADVLGLDVAVRDPARVQRGELPAHIT